MKKSFVLSALALALSSYAFSAQAFSLDFTVGQTTSTEAGAVTETFAGGLPSNYTGGALYNASATDVTSKPVGSTDNFWSIGNSVGQTGPGVITFAAPVSYFGFLWGSVDDYNTITFYTPTKTYAFTGQDIANLNVPGFPANGNQSISGFLNAYDDVGFTKITFTSTSNAFETDNHAYITAVPEPESYAMMLAGLGLMGFVAKRRKG